MKRWSCIALVVLGWGCTDPKERAAIADRPPDAARFDQAVPDAGMDAALPDAALPDASLEEQLDAAPDMPVPDALPDAAPPPPIGPRRVAGNQAVPLQFNQDATVLLYLQDDTLDGGDNHYWLHHGPTDARLDLGLDALTRVQLADDGRSVYWYANDRTNQPRAGVILWSPALMDAVVRVDLETGDAEQGYLFGGGRYLFHDNVIWRVESDGLVEVMRWPPGPRRWVEANPFAPNLALVSAAQPPQSWLVDLENGVQRPIEGGSTTVAWTPAHRVYRMAATGRLMLWSARTDQLSALTPLPPPPQGDWQVVASAHQPPILAYASSMGLRTERAGSNIVQQHLGEPTAIIGWDGDWIITQTPVGGVLIRVNALTGERLAFEGAADRIIQPTRHSDYLLRMRRGAVERWAWATNEGVALGELRGVRDTRNPNLFYNRGQPELYRVVDGAVVVDPGALMHFSPDESLLALSRGDDLTALDVSTLEERNMYPQGLPEGRLGQWILGNGMMALQVGPPGNTALWIRAAR